MTAAIGHEERKKYYVVVRWGTETQKVKIIAKLKRHGPAAKYALPVLAEYGARGKAPDPQLLRAIGAIATPGEAYGQEVLETLRQRLAIEFRGLLQLEEEPDFKADENPPDQADWFAKLERLAEEVIQQWQDGLISPDDTFAPGDRGNTLTDTRSTDAEKRPDQLPVANGKNFGHAAASEGINESVSVCPGPEDEQTIPQGTPEVVSTLRVALADLGADEQIGALLRLLLEVVSSANAFSEKVEKAFAISESWKARLITILEPLLNQYIEANEPKETKPEGTEPQQLDKKIKAAVIQSRDLAKRKDEFLKEEILTKIRPLGLDLALEGKGGIRWQVYVDVNTGTVTKGQYRFRPVDEQSGLKQINVLQLTSHKVFPLKLVSTSKGVSPEAKRPKTPDRSGRQ